MFFGGALLHVCCTGFSCVCRAAKEYPVRGLPLQAARNTLFAAPVDFFTVNFARMVFKLFMSGNAASDKLLCKGDMSLCHLPKTLMCSNG